MKNIKSITLFFNDGSNYEYRVGIDQVIEITPSVMPATEGLKVCIRKEGKRIWYYGIPYCISEWKIYNPTGIARNAKEKFDCTDIQFIHGCGFTVFM